MSKNHIKSNNMAREVLMQSIFQMEALGDGSSEQLARLLSDNKLPEEEKKYIERNFETIISNIDNIDEIINKYSKNWNVYRMPKTDLAILRVGVGEIMFSKERQPAIVINECVKISKKFGDNDTYKFINGILGEVVRKEYEEN